MSVASPVIDIYDGENRRLYLKQGVTDFHWIDDIYLEYRRQRAINEDFRKWEPLLTAEGNKPKGGGRFTPRFVTLLQGTKVIPFNEAGTINVTGEAITDNADVDPTLFDISSITSPVILNVAPPDTEVIVIGGAGGGITEQDKLDIADAVWDENITEHNAVDTTGKTLSDAKKAAKFAGQISA